MDGKPTRGHALSQLTTFSRFRDPTFDTYYPIQNNVVRNESINARAGVVKERKMTLVSGLQLYPKAIAWSMLLSCTIVMEGYDKSLIGSFFASPSFTQRFGTLSAHNGPTDGQTYQLSTGWQTGLINASIGAEIFGLFLNGYLTDRFGYKKTMLGALVFMNFAIFVSFFAVSLEMLLVSQLLCGMLLLLLLSTTITNYYRRRLADTTI
jgi:MFS transporter, SP family, general alpha glucoside:H+ symporter